MITMICFFIGHKFVQGTPVMFGMIPGTPFCERCGKSKVVKIKKEEENENQ